MKIRLMGADIMKCLGNISSPSEVGDSKMKLYYGPRIVNIIASEKCMKTWYVKNVKRELLRRVNG